VDTNANGQIRQILEPIAEEARTSFDVRLKSLFTDASRKAELRSVSTINAALLLMTESGDKVLNQCFVSLDVQPNDLDVSAPVQTAMESHFRFLEIKLEDVLRICGGKKDGLIVSAVETEAKLNFEAIRSGIQRKIEQRRLSFGQQDVLSSSLNKSLPPDEINTLKKNLGGRPRAEHWDEMWASVAMALYSGALQPRNQADIERAMLDWCAANSISTGETAIRMRAKKLWKQIVIDR
jgi:hypothetical protein